MKTSVTSQYSRRKKACFYLLLGGFTVIISLLVMEIAVRILLYPINLWEETGRKVVQFDNTHMNWMRGWAFLDAFSAYRGRPGRYSQGKTVNEHGFISTPNLTIAKPENTIRIVFLGGSSTAGTGMNLADQDTWPWQVWEKLKARHSSKHIEFINGALGGYTSFESYGRLWSRIRFFSPDIIVVYHGWNEMYYFNLVDNMPSWRTLADGSWSFDRLSMRVVNYNPHWIDYLIWPSQVLIRLRMWLSPRVSNGELGRLTNTPTTIAHDYDPRAISIWRTNLRLFKEAARIFDAELFVVKQATLMIPGLPIEQVQRCGYETHGFDYDAHLKAYQNIYRVIDEEIAPERIIDATSLSGIPEYFYDAVHPTEFGCQKIAEIVTEKLLIYLRTQEE